jgi:hypothetical protein
MTLNENTALTLRSSVLIPPTLKTSVITENNLKEP